jgi:hypothetical protein
MPVEPHRSVDQTCEKWCSELNQSPGNTSVPEYLRFTSMETHRSTTSTTIPHPFGANPGTTKAIIEHGMAVMSVFKPSSARYLRLNKVPALYRLYAYRFAHMVTAHAMISRNMGLLALLVSLVHQYLGGCVIDAHGKASNITAMAFATTPSTNMTIGMLSQTTWMIHIV